MHAKVSEGAKMSTSELDTDSKYLPQLKTRVQTGRMIRDLKRACQYRLYAQILSIVYYRM